MFRLMIGISLCLWAQKTRRLTLSHKDWASVLENPTRDAYQRPEELLDWIEAKLGSLRGKRIYDLGAGTGYYAWRFVKRGATVIAMDIDEGLLRYMERRRDSLNISPAQWEIRKGVPDRPILSPKEADWIFIADVYHHLPNRVAYLKQLHALMPEGGYIIFVEWAPRESPVGPPLSHRLFPTQIETELQAAGFEVRYLEEALLPYHYILVGQKPSKPVK
ncbi:MAG: class I SAM-dependent methyltransferase [Bacteroidia bacterium]|nr:class I SAM-dependent methyltransferase [Bacteroidia bacterium]MCX7764365.1 class I SAM-dependent methyltransferase [Bacteroidia bacterium]